jgi:hypothetical protein
MKRVQIKTTNYNQGKKVRYDWFPGDGTGKIEILVNGDLISSVEILEITCDEDLK